MELSDFQRKAVLLIFISILIGAVLLARKEPLKEKGVTEQGSAPAAQKIPTPVKVDINTASISVIMQLPGIGPSLAKGIIDNRPFTNINDLLKVPGIGEKRLSRIKDLIDLPESPLPALRAPLARSTSPARKQSEKIDLNKATVEQLSTIPSIGLKLANAIIDYREKIGRFNNLEGLMNVPRIGQKTYEKIKEYLYIEQMAEMSEAPPRTFYDSRINPKVKCPYCGKQLWEEGKRKQKYIRCPNCLKSLNGPRTF